MKQPTLGIASTLLVMVIALAFVSLFSFPTFAGWVAFFLLCVIPIQIVMAVTWGSERPKFAASQPQPTRGLLLTFVALAVGVAATAVVIYGVGAGITPPPPIVAHWTIVAVPITFWAAIMFGGWPFTTWIKNQIAAGLVLLLACYVVNAVLFRLFFNYEFMAGAPVYAPALDPHGLFNGWSALVFYVTALAGMFLLICFDLWPLTTVPALMRQPTLGVVWTICALAFGAVAFYIGVEIRHMDVVRFLIRVPVPLIFGSIIVLNMLQNSLFASLKQPLKGILNVIVVVIIGTVLSMAYGLASQVITGRLTAGPPAYDFEIWLASALLSVTFPFLIFYAEFLKYWPLAKPPSTEVAAASATR